MNAPIIIFAYNREDKLKECIRTLAEADGHEATEVYVFSDGIKDMADRIQTARINEVRRFLNELKSGHPFGGLHVTERADNMGLAENVISGVSEIIDKYGKVIVLEDDLTVTADFITYMNVALDYYADDEKVWSVTGFSEPLKVLKSYGHDIYMGYRGCSYGWGTWKDRWDTVDWEMTRYDEVLHDRTMRKKLERGGRDMTRILKDQKAGIVNSWAIRWCLSQSMQDRYTVYPVSSFVENTGVDGSGTHQRFSKHINDNRHIYGESVRFEHLKPDDRINREFYRKHSDVIRRALRSLNPAGIRRQIERIRA